MGCATSKLEDSPAVLLCRDRCAFLEEALKSRSIFAEAHLAYLQSLSEVGLSLNRFFSQDLEASGHTPPSPVLNLPAHSKGHAVTSPPHKSHQHRPSHSDSGSHLHFHSDDSEYEDDSGSESLHHFDVSSPVHGGYTPYRGGYGMGYDNMNHQAGGGVFMNVNYMRNQATPSVIYTQQPLNPENMHMGPSSSSYYPYSGYANSNYQNSGPPYSGYATGNYQNSGPPYSGYATNYQNSGPSYPGYNFNSNYNGYPNQPSYVGQNTHFSSSAYQQAPYGISVPHNSAVPSTSKAPPPPPAPPSSSPWEFLNLFGSYDNYYPTYNPTRDSRELREAEGIPDLEDDDEVVKEVHVHKKFMDKGQSSYSRSGVPDKNVRAANETEYEVRPPAGMENDPVEYDVHVVDKNVIGAEGALNNKAAGFKQHAGFFGDSEVLKEIEIQFERAAGSGRELAKLLDVDTFPRKRKLGLHRVSSKLWSFSMVPSLATTSKSSVDSDSTISEIDQEVQLRAKKLSSVLHKLYLWEKKLYQEVKIEENLRILHDTKSRKLKRMDDRGSEATKIDVTRASVRTLSTQIQMAIQVVDKISVKINSLRDDDLWPQLNEFLQGLMVMWKSMLECHRYQCQAIGEAKRLDAFAVRKYLIDDHYETSRKLEHDLINWTLRFSYWVRALKDYVRAMNNWLMKCLLYVPEETADGIVPFSPGRIGAPSIFVVCYHWWQSLERVSEKEVVASMRDLASTVLQLGEQEKAAMRQKMLVNKDERKIRSLDREEQKIQKEMKAIEKRLALISSDERGLPLSGHVYQSETSKGGSLQASLQHVLEAMERYAANSLKVYEELQQQIQEDHLNHEQNQGL